MELPYIQQVRDNIQPNEQVMKAEEALTELIKLVQEVQVTHVDRDIYVGIVGGEYHSMVSWIPAMEKWRDWNKRKQAVLKTINELQAKA